jgi:hypothetical protein
MPKDDGSPCSDNNACTTGDICSAGICASAPVPCGACMACAPATGTCAAAPRAACRASTRPRSSSLIIKNASSDRSDAVAWRWTRGAATTAGELGNPVGGDDYALCLFDESSATPALLLALPILGGQDCGGTPCWKPHASGGFVYDNRDVAPDGVLKMSVSPGAERRSKAQLNARGSFLTLPAAPLPLPLRVQLQMENGTCLETRYQSDGVSRNDSSGQFRAHGAP